MVLDPAADAGASQVASPEPFGSLDTRFVLRDQLLRSGVPLMIAAVCFLVLAYLARVRGERFLRYWTYAWAFLVLRQIWNIVWGSPFPSLWVGDASAFMRMAFAGCILAGVEELRGRRVNAWIVFGAAALFIAAKVATDPIFTPERGVVINLAAMALLMLAASWRLGTYRPLPSAERALASIALAVYAVLTAVMPLVPDGPGSTLLENLFFVGWTAQLCIGVGMLALFFRASYDAELRAEQKRATSLTEALQGFLPICMHCKSIRDEQNAWKPIEQYVADRTSVTFSHGLCPTCVHRHYGELNELSEPAVRHAST
jgi:hypothetical protein